ncbi:MAG TPA: carboxypeptidase regulatory-like domain-containing protein [Candidatus Aminicenantes bacterium]|nr:carboxypeptidase regulatory-like domain-containing protein [Candidatus Aminicenantes bacterium]
MTKSGKAMKAWMVTAVCLGLVWPAVAIAQTQSDEGVITGVVYQKDKETPLEKARVRLQSVKKQEKKKTYTSQPTNENGLYALSGIPEGRYKVIVISKGGRKLKTRTVVNITAGTSLERDFHVKARKGFFGNCTPCGISLVLIGLLFLL